MSQSKCMKLTNASGQVSLNRKHNWLYIQDFFPSLPKHKVWQREGGCGKGKKMFNST